MTLEKAAGKLVPRGWLKEFLKRDKEGITGNLDKLFKDCAVDIFGKDKVVHLEDGYWSSWWAGESQGNWLHGLVALAFLTEDKELVARAKAQVDNILANQAEDGYIGVYKEGNRYIVTKRFGELWTQSRVMNTLLCYYGYTKEERVLQALVRMADNIVANVKGSVYEVPDEDGSKGHSLMIVEGLYELYRLTGKEAYRDFSEKLYLDYCAHASQFLQDDIRMRNLFDPTVPFVGHGPHTCEMLRIPLLLYRMTGKEEYLTAFRCGMEKLQQNLSLSGSCKSDEFIGTYQSSLVMENNERTSVFGGSVPLPSTAYEYCSTTEISLDYIAAEHILGDLSYAEKLEWTVYNAGFASKHPSGKMIQYLGADNMYDASHAVNPRYDYSPTHDDAAVCCAPNACRLMPLAAEQAFVTDGERLIANLFLPVRFTTECGGETLTIEEETAYPFRNTVEFAAKGKGKTAFAFRIPAWAKEISVTKNGASAQYTAQDGMAILGELTGGDKVRVCFAAEPQILRAVDGTFALKYGTLLFAKDIPADCKRYRKYDGAKGFWDCDFTPKAHEDWNYTILIRDAATCEEAKAEYDESVAYPLDGAYVALSVRALDRYAYPVDLKLLPIGATTLRRTTFPVMIDRKGIYKK